MGHPEFHAQRVGNTGGGLGRNKNASSTKRDVVMKFYGLPPIGQKQRRPMGGAQFHSPRVGEAGGRLKRNRVPAGRCLGQSESDGSDKDSKLASATRR